MGNKKIIMLVGSILLGALAGFALLGYVRGVQDDVLEEVSRVPVFVVSQTIQEGTTASAAQATISIQESEIESQFRPATAITDLSQIDGQIAVANLAANQVLVAGMFADPSVVQTTFSDQIDPDHVAFSVTIDEERAVNGFIEPGDFVDIVVLGSPPATNEETENVFEASAVESPYTQPARTLFRGIRIISINNDIVGAPAPAEGEPVAAEETTNTLNITFAVPSGSAQRILSVPPANMVLQLLPTGWEPTRDGETQQQENEVLEAINIGEDLPGENPDEITPYGAEGFVDFLADGVADDDADNNIVPPADDGFGTPVDEVDDTDEATENTDEGEEVDEEEGQ